MVFEFKDFDHLSDGIIDLVIEAKGPADPKKDYAPAYHYKITLHGSKEGIGTIRLRVGNNLSLLTSGHVGYGINPPHQGHHYAERACRLLQQVARAHGMSTLIITCDPENPASRRTCERLGATLTGIYDVPKDHDMYAKGRRKVCRYEWTLGTITDD
jgi:tagatose 1,6-diphosphate aldolase